jgi:hypothetical protein
MRKAHFVLSDCNAGPFAAAVLACSCVLAAAQAPSVMSPASAGTLQPATAAGLKDTLLAKATSLYDSTAKSGLRSFDCQVHPDWKKMMSSARKGAPVADDDPKLVLVGTVKIALHASINGSSAIEWQIPAHPEKPLDPHSIDILNQVHQGLENTLLATLKLWITLVNGSIAAPFGKDDASLSQTADGYTLRSKDKGRSVTEDFDRDLVLKHLIAVDSGTTADIEPAYHATPHGLLIKSFIAHVQPPGVAPESAQVMNVVLEYQAVAAFLIPARFTVDMPNLVEMDFVFDGCTVNSAPKQQ